MPSLPLNADRDPTNKPILTRLRSVALSSLAGRAVLASVILVAIGAAIAPSTVSLSAFLSMLPFIAILAVASIGQHLVILQRGLDISIAGTMSLAAVLVTRLPSADAGNGEVLFYVVLALGVGLLIGALNGIVITLLGVPALVTTIGVNSVLFGLALILSAGVPSAAPPDLAHLAISLTLGIPNTIWIALLVAALSIFIIDRTTVGRRFTAVAVSPASAFAVAIPMRLYRIATFMVAGLLYALAGVMLAGFLSIPNIFAGNDYILASVAAVVIGGNSVAGGARGSVLATVIGAFFLTFLGQLVLSANLDRSMQYVVEALIVIGGVGLPMLLKLPRQAGNLTARLNPALAPAGPKVVLAGKGKPTLELIEVRKNFGPVEALKAVTFRAWPGEVHAVLGENGAGKSTLINIAAGVLRATSGSVVLAGKDITSGGPRQRREEGISVAYQHPALAKDLTVLENLVLAAPRLTVEAAEALIAQVATRSLRMSPRDLVGELTLAQSHVVEIVRAMASNPKVLILDEPTEPFQHDDTRQLFGVIRGLRDAGVAIVYVSHRLHEVTELADRVSIMRDGELVASRMAQDITETEIVALIAGRPLAQMFPPKGDGLGVPILEVSGLAGPGFHDISMSVRAGEIVGLAGVEGEGQREVLRALAGVHPHAAGLVTLDGRKLTLSSPGAARSAGLGFVSDDRHAEGLFLNLSVRENLGIGVLDQVASGGIVRRLAEAALATGVVNALRVRTPSIETTVGELSGGNQQKVLFGREISAGPRVLLVDEPTKGVDVGARSEIYQRLRTLADSGTAVIIAASDGVELEGLCDRVLVFARGSITRELTGADVTDTAITAANLTSTAARAQVARQGQRRNTLAGLLAGDRFPAVVLACLTALIMIGTQSMNEYFLSGFNIGQMLQLLAILSLVALAQFCTIVVGGIDLSVGPLAGFVVVMASFFMGSDASPQFLFAGGVLLIGVCAAFGYIQGVLVTWLRLPAIVVTLASFIGLQGVSLLLRPRPGGTISDGVSEFFGTTILGVPAGMLIALGAVLVFEWALFRSQAGRKLRAVGSNPLGSLRLGVDGGRVSRIAFLLSGSFAGLAGLMLAGQIGIGSGTTGVDFSLMSITAVVLGGVSVTGGRGSALSVLFGAALVQATTSASSFLNADSAYQYTVVGAITLVGASLFSLARGQASAVHA